MKKSLIAVAVSIAAFAFVGHAYAHPAFNPFRHMGGHKTVAVAVTNSEKTLSTAHPGKTVAMERWTQDHLRSIHR